MREHGYDGMILAAAGLKRLGADAEFTRLKWMTSAPAQGAIAVVAKKSDINVIKALEKLNHRPSFIAVSAERDFMRMMGAGCSTAVGALAIIENEAVKLRAEVLSENGDKKIEVELSDNIEASDTIGIRAAEIAFKKGAEALLKKA